MKELARFLLRGALGGALLQLLWSAFVLAAYPEPEALLVLALLLLIPASVGALIGGLLWLLSRKSRHDSGLIKRIVIGASFATLLCAGSIYLTQHDNSWSRRDSLAVLVFSLIIGIEIGIPAAILARKKETIVIQQLGLFTSFPLLAKLERIVR